MIQKLLVCNRGEIAVRIVRACRELDIPVAVAYSAADRDSLAVTLADDAVCIGPGPASRSYLNPAALIHACDRVGADAVHPGYGFLSEDAGFAAACEEVGITFVGPRAHVIAGMSDKVRARAMMVEAGLPVPAGSEQPLQDADEARALAAQIGYPVILKAAAGGGGRGMAVVHHSHRMADALHEVRAVARTVFLDDRVFLEKFVTGARHVEFQVLGDQHGNMIHLGERDCSIQRRRQKLLEESPSGALDPQLRARMGEAAVRGATFVGYHSAGTMEFLVGADGTFTFMEMNTRIQVEHPVTEMLTGVDLVAWMIRVANGERLPWQQHEIRPRGHVIECRINSEDPSRDWAGSFGRLEEFRPPSGPGVRVDTHGYSGYRIPPFYDSLLAKVIVQGDTRDEAIARMSRALGEFACTGVATTIGFHQELLEHETFVAGRHQLDFVEQYLREDGRLGD